jgi:hypothetical protein
MLTVLLVGLVFGGILAWRWIGSAQPAANVNVAGALSGGQVAARPLSGAQPSGNSDCKSFDARFGDLQQRLSALVGEPVECAHQSIDNGDLLQRTTNGLLTLRATSGVALFTNGVEHWALLPDGMKYWLGSSVDPPADAQALGATQVRATVQPTLEPNRAQVANTDGQGVVLRASANENDTTPRGFMDGTPVTILQRQGADWAYVRGDNGQEGWIPAKYLRGQ